MAVASVLRALKSRYGTILVVALPLIAGALSDQLTVVVDTALLGRYSVNAIAAVGAVSSFFFSMLIVIAVAGIGNAILVAQRLAGNQLKSAGSAIRHTMVLVPSLAIVFTVFSLIFAEQIAGIFNDDPAVVEQGARYLRIRAFGLPLIAIESVMRDVYTADKRIKWVFYNSWLINIVNAILSGLLIFGVGALPELGVAGAAIGGVVADVVGILFTLFVFIRFNYYRRMQIGRMVFSKAEFKKLIFLGAPTVLSVISVNAGSVIMFAVVGRIGTVEQAAASVLFSSYGILFEIAFGFYESAQLLAARAIGAGKQREIHRLYRRHLELVLTTFVLFAIPFFAFGGAIFGIYTDFEEVLAQTASVAPIFAASLPLIGWTMINVAFMRGFGSTLTEMFTNLIGVWLVQVPLLWLLGITFEVGLAGILLANLSYWLVRGTSNFALILRILKNPHRLKIQ